MPDSTELCSIFSGYQLVWVSLMDYTTLASTPEQQQNGAGLEEQMRTCKSHVQAVINDAID